MQIPVYDLELSDKIPHLIKTGKRSCEIEAIGSPMDLAAISQKAFRLGKKAEERVILLALDTKLVPIAAFELSHGTVNGSLISPREVCIRLLLCGAVRFAIAHNHPSGDLKPSSFDNEITKRLKEAGELISVGMLDHVIVGSGRGYFSYLEHKYEF